ncbi:LysR family transcriptional regulator [Scleromatobacter humisilvae]|uniref:LysR family transcriptional regulator n=1 Tax=Scleromatobacter humisilvae TaxID=2897159 RepID=A0A9X2C3F3_9BURK|nr:LysR family transcriptional regulator [Scleromatobacter humisilvae]MCK9688069.1 LysR family transcriptional regulator [Scleromatobacter humisilvae]
MTKPSATADRFELMETFVRIVDAGNLSAAATQLGTTQPTVSRRLQALERSLGVRLLRRSTHSMTLTEDGQRCLERARELIANWHAFEADLRGAGDEPEGTLRVIAPHAFGQQQLVGPLADYLARHPRVNVEWLLHDRRPDFIAEGIDCAIQVGDIDDQSVVAIRLAEVPRIVVAAPALAARLPATQAPDDLARLPWLAMRPYYRTEVALSAIDGGAQARFPIAPRMSTDSLYALRTAAVTGVGVAIASAWLVADDIAQGRLVHLAPQWRAAPLPVYLVYPQARFYPARLRRFLDVIRAGAVAAFTPQMRVG